FNFYCFRWVAVEEGSHFSKLLQLLALAATDTLCRLGEIGCRCSGNWVVIVGEYLLSERKPLRRLRALTAFCCFGRACKSLLFFVGVSDALELVSSSIAGGHTEEIATGNSEDCVLKIDAGKL